MTLADFFSCALLAYGGPIAMFLLTVANDPLRIIVIVLAAFCWLISFLLASIVWFAVVPLRTHLAFGLVVAVIIQELFRYVLYKVVLITHTEMMLFSKRPIVSRLELSYVTGLGFGLMSGAFAFLNILADTAGPGTLGLKSGSEFFPVFSAAATLPMILLNVAWSVVMCSGCDEGDVLKLGWVVGSHLLLSTLTLLNRSHLYAATLPAAYVILIVTTVIALRSSGVSLKTLRCSFTAKPAVEPAQPSPM